MELRSLNPLAPVFETLTQTRNWLYDENWLQPCRLKIPVISVGNITMGGTGKTPFIHWLIEEVSRLNYRPGVVSRNYRATHESSGFVNTHPGSFQEFGDEAVLLKLKNPTVPIFSGSKKWQSAIKMESDKENCNANVLLVDDGFQHRKLHRDLDIVLLDCSVSISDYNWPIQGRLRESLKNLSRADVIVFTRWEQKNKGTTDFLQKVIQEVIQDLTEKKLNRKLKGKLEKNFKEPLQLFAEQMSESPRWILGRPWNSAESLSNAKGLAFCGLGNPQSFLKTLEQKGMNIDKFISFPDHAKYSEKTIQELVEVGKNFDYLITSEKDMIKLQEWPFQGPSLLVMPMSLTINGPMEAFREKLARTLWTNS